MSRIDAKPLEELDPELQSIMAAGEEIMGFTSNDSLIMAHKPQMLKAMLALVQAVYMPGSVALDLKKMVALMSSSAAGCQYCEAHTQHGALKEGIAAEKLEQIWSFDSSPLYSDAERAALELARSSAFTPNQTTDQQFDKLRSFYSEEQIVELVGVIALFGFLNRWNSTMATDLEATPRLAIEAAGLKAGSKQQETL